jgi:hypothetical protein
MAPYYLAFGPALCGIANGDRCRSGRQTERRNNVGITCLSEIQYRNGSAHSEAGEVRREVVAKVAARYTS